MADRVDGRITSAILRGAIALAGACDLPRSGPPLSEATLHAFDRLDVVFINQSIGEGMAWYDYLNKPNALLIGERYARTSLITWLDSDLLFSGEPEGFIIPGDVDVAASPSNRIGGTTGPGDPNEGLWQAMTRALGVDLDDLPWVVTTMDHARVRLYFNSGVFTYRRESGFAHHYLDATRKVLRAHIKSFDRGTILLEQAAFGIAMVKAGLRFALWPDMWNYNIGRPCNPQEYRPEAFKAARVIHYHDCFNAPPEPILMDLMREHQPVLAAWLEPMLPQAITIAKPRLSVANRFTRLHRRVRARLHWRKLTVPDEVTSTKESPATAARDVPAAPPMDAAS